MSRAVDAARGRMSEQGNLGPYPVTPDIEPVPAYPAPGLDDEPITLEPRLPLLGPEPEPAPL